MNIKKHIPNFITILNLVCGVGAIFYFVKATFIDDVCTGITQCWGAPSGFAIKAGLFLIILATILDFLDGFAARSLNVKSEIGAQLDSLADMVTFGVAPGFLFSALASLCYPEIGWLKFLFVLIPIFSALRLAKFNVDIEQTTYFKGIATPANALFWVGIGFILLYGIQIPYYIMAILVVVLSLLMTSNFKMFSLKVSNLELKGDNIYRVLLIVLALVTVILCLLLANIFFAIPIIIILYILLSIPYHLNHSKK